MKKKMILLSLIFICLCACDSKPEWQKHMEKGTELSRQNKYSEAMSEFDEAIALNPEGAEIYIQRAYAQILNRTASEGVIRFDPIRNYDLAIKDLKTAEELDSEKKLQDEIGAAYVFADHYGEMINTLAPEDLHIDTRKKDRETCTPSDPIEYSYAQWHEGVSDSCEAFDENDVLIYSDFYNAGKENAGDHICRIYYFYDEEGKLIRREYKWDSNAQWYELIGGYPHVVEFEYDENGVLSKATFLNPPDYWITRIDYYDKWGRMDHGDYYDRNGNITKTDDYKDQSGQSSEDWQVLLQDAIYASNTENYEEALSLLDKAQALHAEDPDIYLTRFTCLMNPLWNKDGVSKAELDEKYDALVESLDKGLQYGGDPSVVDMYKKMLDVFTKYVSGEGELQFPTDEG